jgi:hypothetical protein
MKSYPFFSHRVTRSTDLKRLIALLIAGALLGMLVPTSAQAQETLPTVNVGGTCTIEEGSGTPAATEDIQGTFAGTFEVTRFVVRQGQLFARGTLQGVCTATDPVVGTVTETVNQVVRIPVFPIGTTATCEILDLTLGPLHLDLLGLIVDLNQVHLTITAEQGPGNLLGNLLCAIAGLLDGNFSNQALAALLNRILAILG